MKRSALDDMNLTELVQKARDEGHGNVARDRAALYEALDRGDVEKCPLEAIRKRMEAHIKANYRRLKTQLPGCTGVCTTFGCPDIIVQRCWEGSKEEML